MSCSPRGTDLHALGESVKHTYFKVLKNGNVMTVELHPDQRVSAKITAPESLHDRFRTLRRNVERNGIDTNCTQQRFDVIFRMKIFLSPGEYEYEKVTYNTTSTLTNSTTATARSGRVCSLVMAFRWRPSVAWARCACANC